MASTHPAGPPPEPAGPGIFEEAVELAHAYRAMAGKLLRVLTLELRLAGARLGIALGLMAAAGLVLATGWIALVGAGVAFLVELGLGWPGALAATAVVFFCGALGLAWAVRGQFRRVSLQRTAQHLSPAAVAADAPASGSP